MSFASPKNHKHNHNRYGTNISRKYKMTSHELAALSIDLAGTLKSLNAFLDTKIDNDFPDCEPGMLILITTELNKSIRLVIQHLIQHQAFRTAPKAWRRAMHDLQREVWTWRNEGGASQQERIRLKGSMERMRTAMTMRQRGSRRSMEAKRMRLSPSDI